MFVVIFRAKVAQLDAAYLEMAARMRELALNEFGCLDFQAVTEGADEIALSYWPDEQSIGAWKAQTEHLVAQQMGRHRWYASYDVQIAEVKRAYSFRPSTEQ